MSPLCSHCVLIKAPELNSELPLLKKQMLDYTVNKSGHVPVSVIVFKFSCLVSRNNTICTLTLLHTITLQSLRADLKHKLNHY